MKKFKKIDSFTILKKEEMKNIKGGYENYCCNACGTYYPRPCGRVTAPGCQKIDVQCALP